MSFIESFYSFNVLYYSCTKNKEQKFRFKVPKYPLESATFFSLRILAFCLNYDPELKFSESPYDPKLPTLYTKDYTDQYSYIIQIGLHDYKFLKSIPHKIYLEEKDLPTSENFSFKNEFLELFSENLASSNTLEISEIDNIHYLKINEQELLF